MRFMPFRGGLPLLGKELTEQAARKRTYVIRVLYATVLLGVILLPLHRHLAQAGSVMEMLGVGKRYFEALVIYQFVGIYLFLPSMMCGVITSEKENASLGLLFLTDMGPWELLLQKYLGRLIPMVTFLLLSLPAMAVLYSLGGVTADAVGGVFYLQLLTCLQIGALALMCSTLCRSTVGAFMLTYLGGALFYFLPALLYMLGHIQLRIGSRLEPEVFLGHFPPFVLFDQDLAFTRALTSSGRIVATTLLFLLVARWALVRRAFGVAWNPMLSFFQRLDRVFTRWNDRVGGIVAWQVANALPADKPVAWREMEKRTLGRTHYLIRLLLLIEIPVFLSAVAVTLVSTRGEATGLAVLSLVVWVLAALLLAVQGANVVVSERAQRTLDVLLTTPMSGEEIVRQKMTALRRLSLVFVIPLLSLLAIRLCLFVCVASEPVWSGMYQADSITFRLMGGLCAIAIYLPLVRWVSLWIGMQARTRFQAIMRALLVLVGWCVLPPLICRLGEEAGWWIDSARYLWLCSPAVSVVMSELGVWGDFAELRHGQPAALAHVLLVLNYAFFGGILWFVRWWCLAHADRHLRRGS